MRVELLVTEDDPGAMEVHLRLQQVLGEDAFETAIQLIVIRSRADAEFLSFPGSPTVRVEGIDLYPPTAGGPAGLGRRSYPSDDDLDGPAVADSPGKRLIRRGIEQARGWGHGRYG